MARRKQLAEVGQRSKIVGSGSLPYAQTMAFTTLMLFQIFNVFNARSDETSAFVNLFTNRWLWAAAAVSLALQLAGRERADAAACVRHRRVERRRLELLRGGRELSVVAERNQ
jgi:Cation transporting ATPase, C-terminus